MKSSREWMRSSRVVRASDIQCRSRNCPGFDPSILRSDTVESEGRQMKQYLISDKKKNLKKSPIKVYSYSLLSFGKCSMLDVGNRTVL
jgi:hypothetical protein